MRRIYIFVLLKLSAKLATCFVHRPSIRKGDFELYFQQHSTYSVEQVQFHFNPSLHECNEVISKRARKFDEQKHLRCNYSCNKLHIQTSNNTNKTRATILIQPIGVGIGRWYYDRLLEELSKYDFSNIQYDEHIFLAPDLLGCGTASDIRRNGDTMKSLPLLTVDDWCLQMIDLMKNIEQEMTSSNLQNLDWVIVSNGGCVPIALEIARNYVTCNEDPLRPIFRGRLRSLVLSATPSVESLVRLQNYEKVRQSYNILSGILGKVFWWYALRRNGAFIERFSDKNLLASKPSIEWTHKCVETANSFDGRSRYSTFAFLAGVLNGGNQSRMDSLKDTTDITVDIITGGDRRKNPARSWFWEKRISQSKVMTNSIEQTSLVEVLIKNGNSARERIVSGRRCPAYEDPHEFANALLDLLGS